MTPAALLMLAGGLLLTGGLVGIVTTLAGIRVLPERPARRVKAAAVERRWVTPVTLAAVGAGVLVLLLTGWPVAALGVAGAVVFVPRVLGGGKAGKRLIIRTEALADWTRRLADLIASGAASSTRDALARSASSAPAAIEVEVGHMVSRMGPQGLETALRRFAREVGDPAAEKIAGQLILRERNGGPGLVDVLTALASDLEDRARMVREVEAERAKPRGNMRTILSVTGALVAGMMLLARTRTFLSSYSSPLGQALLVVVVLVFATALRWMRRLSDPPPPPTVLIDPPARSGWVSR
jgi:tight adherence protein B